MILATFVTYAVYLGNFLFKGQGGYLVFHNLRRLFMNATFLNAFDYSEKSQMLITGGWSLQVEFSCYFLLAAILLFVKREQQLSVIVVVCAAGLAYRLFWFPTMNAELAWQNYIYFPSQVAFFCLGIILIELASRIRFWGKAPWLAVIAAALFLSVDVTAPIPGFSNPYAGPAATIYYGGLAGMAMIGMLHWSPTGIIGNATSFIGDISYSVYIAHPLVYSVYHFFGGPKTVSGYGGCIVLTVLISMVLYKWLEQPFIRLGSRMTSRKQRPIGGHEAVDIHHR